MDQPRRSRASGLLRERLGERKRDKQEGATRSGREKEDDKDDDQLKLSLDYRVVVQAQIRADQQIIPSSRGVIIEQ